MIVTEKQLARTTFHNKIMEDLIRIFREGNFTYEKIAKRLDIDTETVESYFKGTKKLTLEAMADLYLAMGHYACLKGFDISSLNPIPERVS